MNDEEGTYVSAEIDNGPFGDDPNPPKWPNNRVAFNRWFQGLHAFIYALQFQFNWYKNPLGSKAKYVTIRIDTRNGNYLVYCDGKKEGDPQIRISPDDLGLVFKGVELKEKASG